MRDRLGYTASWQFGSSLLGGQMARLPHSVTKEARQPSSATPSFSNTIRQFARVRSPVTCRFAIGLRKSQLAVVVPHGMGGYEY